jgi:23S rRNA A2030 N6-methylase RlmJ
LRSLFVHELSHAYHAGNHADVFKHITLSRIFALMARKDTPFAYLDSHSGVGLYDLLGDEASRTGEWESGIGRLWQRDDLPALAADYLEVRALNPDGGLEYYPGSPELARRLTRRRTACCSTSCTRKTAACSRPTWAANGASPCTRATAGIAAGPAGGGEAR